MSFVSLVRSAGKTVLIADEEKGKFLFLPLRNTRKNVISVERSKKSLSLYVLTSSLLSLSLSLPPSQTSFIQSTTFLTQDSRNRQRSLTSGVDNCRSVTSEKKTRISLSPLSSLFLLLSLSLSVVSLSLSFFLPHLSLSYSFSSLTPLSM